MFASFERQIPEAGNALPVHVAGCPIVLVWRHDCAVPAFHKSLPPQRRRDRRRSVQGARGLQLPLPRPGLSMASCEPDRTLTGTTVMMS